MLERRLAGALEDLPVPIQIVLPSGNRVVAGDGPPEATIHVRTKRAARLLMALDENGIAESYVRGEIDIEGSMQEVLKCRGALKRRHGLSWLVRFLVSPLFGQVFTNRLAIRRHYELEPEFYLAFLDSTWPAYSQGVFLSREETLAKATERKFSFATEECGIDRHSHVLEIGPGWGAYTKYLLERVAARITALTNSPRSKEYLAATFPSDRFDVVAGDLLAFAPEERFDAVSIMGVLEHLPQYDRVCRKFRELVKPGGYVYADASACTTKYAASRFIYEHIWPYNHSFLHLESFLEAARSEGFEIVSVHDDSKSYQYTIEAWAGKLESNRRRLVERFGEYDFRRFRLYLWGSEAGFEEGALQCHRLVLRAPG